MKRALLAISIASFILISCNNSKAEDSLDLTSTNSTTTSKSTDSLTNPSNLENNINQSNVSNSSATGSEDKNKKTSGKLNPEHGQPGHRCELPVGAPLDGPAPATSQPTLTPLPATQTITPNVQQQPVNQENVKVAEGMNPAHGQPGHRCDLPVGAPLNK